MLHRLDVGLSEFLLHNQLMIALNQESTVSRCKVHFLLISTLQYINSMLLIEGFLGRNRWKLDYWKYVYISTAKDTTTF